MFDKSLVDFGSFPQETRIIKNVVRGKIAFNIDQILN